MRIKKIYFNRMYDQWRGEPLYIEDGLDDDKLYIRIMDVEDYKNGAINAIIADYKDLNGATYSILGNMDFDKKLAIFKIPLSILSNNGVYEVGFSLSFNARNEDGMMLKTAIQTFEIIDAIEADDEAVAQDPHYPILVDLINRLADYKVDTSEFPTRDEMNQAIEDNLNSMSMDEILKQINERGYITLEQLDRILKNYITKFESSDFAKQSDLNKFVTNIKYLQDLERYALKSSLNNFVLKEQGKTLTTHDLTDELYNKLVNLNVGDSGLEVDLSDYQKKVDNILNTKDKSITGAINELNEDFKKQEDNIDKILEVVDTPPIFTKPTLNLFIDKTKIEHNVATNITLTPSYNKNDAGIITNYTLKKYNNVLVNSNILQSYTDNITVSHGNSVTYTATVNYASGESKTSTFGVVYDGLSAGNISANNTVRAYAPSYYGVIDNDTITETDIPNLISVLNTSKSMTTTYKMINQRSVYMYPKNFGALINIRDINNFDYINSYTRSEITYNDVDYYIYILTDSVEIDEFKQTFNYKGGANLCH